MAAAKKSEPEAPVETRTTTYLPIGVGANPYQGEPTLDPELAKIREAEIKSNDVEVFRSFEEPTIDPVLVKARQAELDNDAEQVKASKKSNK